jgi:hypothetical protein
MTCEELFNNALISKLKFDTAKSINENLYQWFKQSDQGTISDAVKNGLSVGIPIDGVPVDANWDSSQNHAQAWKKAIDQGTNRRFSVTEATSILLTFVDSNAVKVYQTCKQENAHTVGLRSEVIDNMESITFRVSFIPLIPGETAVIAEPGPLVFGEEF